MKKNNKTRVIKIRVTDDYINALDAGMKRSMLRAIGHKDQSKAIRFLTMYALLQQCDPSDIPMIQEQLEQNSIYKQSKRKRA